MKLIMLQFLVELLPFFCIFASPWSGCFVDTLKEPANNRVCSMTLTNLCFACPAVQFTIRTQFRRAYLWGTANNETWAYSGQGREKDDIQVCWLFDFSFGSFCE
jgi:hypothetical protein